MKSQETRFAEWWVRYERHLRSARWKNMRRDMERLRGGRCERCKGGGPFELHHRNYERLGRELTSDLELLCRRCHDQADRERERDNAVRLLLRSIEARRGAALQTWATKKYGEDWGDSLDCDDIEKEFDEWFERQEG